MRNGKKEYTNVHAGEIFGIHRKIDVPLVSCVHYLLNLDLSTLNLGWML